MRADSTLRQKRSVPDFACFDCEGSFAKRRVTNRTNPNSYHRSHDCDFHPTTPGKNARGKTIQFLHPVMLLCYIQQKCARYSVGATSALVAEFMRTGEAPAVVTSAHEAAAAAQLAPVPRLPQDEGMHPRQGVYVGQRPVPRR